MSRHRQMLRRLVGFAALPVAAALLSCATSGDRLFGVDEGQPAAVVEQETSELPPGLEWESRPFPDDLGGNDEVCYCLPGNWAPADEGIECGEGYHAQGAGVVGGIYCLGCVADDCTGDYRSLDLSAADLALLEWLAESEKSDYPQELPTADRVAGDAESEGTLYDCSCLPGQWYPYGSSIFCGSGYYEEILYVEGTMCVGCVPSGCP